MASQSPVTAGQPVGEARFVRTILLPVRTPSLRRVFRDSDHAECGGVRITDSVFRLSRNTIGLAGKTRFFGSKTSKVERRGLNFGPLIAGIGARFVTCFRKWEILVTR